MASPREPLSKNNPEIIFICKVFENLVERGNANDRNETRYQSDSPLRMPDFSEVWRPREDSNLLPTV